MSTSEQSRYQQQGGEDNQTKDRIRDTKARLANSNKELDEKKEETPYYSVNEPSLTHPSNQSHIKLRDNGNVDIFGSSTDTGIRIDIPNKTINFIGKEEKSHAQFIRRFVTKDAFYHIDGNWIVNCENSTINARKSATINVRDENMTINTFAKDVVVNAHERDILVNAKRDIIAKAGRDVHVKAENDITATAGRNIKLKAGNEFFLDAGGNCYYKNGGQHFFS